MTPDTHPSPRRPDRRRLRRTDGRGQVRSAPSAAPFRLRTEADVLALVPFTLGFHPERSVVLVVIGRGGRPFLARVDLPSSEPTARWPPDRDPGALGWLTEALVEPAVRNGGGDALVVVYTDEPALGEAAVAALRAGLSAAKIPMLLAVRADGGRCYRLAPGTPDLVGEPYDLGAHELAARAVLDGRVTHASRAELAASLLPPDPERVAAVRAARAALDPLAERRADRRAEVRWALAELGAARRRWPGPMALARLLRAVADVELRDALWAEVTTASAPEHVESWLAVVRNSPEELVAPPAALLAFSAWLAGDGALAWCAVDRSLHADPAYGLARLVGDALEAAVPPSAWTGVDRSALPLYAG